MASSESAIKPTGSTTARHSQMLEKQISDNAAEVSTVSYSMSIGEMASMYRDGELDLHPEFQRLYRWTAEQKSRLIESLLLGLPIPPIFVSERQDSKWDVIDGLQRLSTVLEVMGELKTESGETRPPLELSRTKHLQALQGVVWKDAVPPQKDFPESAKIKLKRARLDVNIIKNTSSGPTKYELFQRLNAGGSQATEQEIRNCLLIMENPEFYQWLSGLGKLDAFRACIPLTDRALEESFDLELVVRFIVLSTASTSELSSITELGEFLTDTILSHASDSNFSKIKMQSAFTDTFTLLAEALGTDSFRRFESSKYTGAMLISLFEVVAVGLGYRALNGGSLPRKSTLAREHKKLWNDKKLKSSSGSGIRASTRIPKTVS